jgi:tetrahydromethanopterin S-methyltransferase subunit G
MTTPEWIKAFPIEEMRPELAREWDRLVALHPEQAERYLATIDRERERERVLDRPAVAIEEGARRESGIGVVLGVLLGVVLGVVLLAVLAVAVAS